MASAFWNIKQEPWENGKEIKNKMQKDIWNHKNKKTKQVHCKNESP